MRIIDWVKNKFNKNNDEQDIDNDDLAYIKVSMKSDMSLEIDSWWSDEYMGKELSFAYGTMLKFLTNGGYDILISSDLTDILQRSDQDTKDFINQVLITWKEGEDFKTMQDKLSALPVVSPLKTFGESIFGV